MRTMHRGSAADQRWTYGAKSGPLDRGLEIAADGEPLVETLAEIAVEALGIGDGGRVDVRADAARRPVAGERDHRGAARQRAERVGALDLRARQVDVLADPADVGGLEVVGLRQPAGELRDERPGEPRQGRSDQAD